MALAPLADTADLPASWQDSADAARALAVASAAIREAAGSAIGETTGTVTIPAPAGTLLPLPGLVRDVTEVKIDGAVVTDFRNVGSGLWRARGWHHEPVDVAVTATFGLGEVPDDIADMCVQLAVAWLRHRAEGSGSTAGLESVAIDDARESYTDEAAGQVSPVFIPEVTRKWLQSRFAGGAVVVETL